MSVVYGIIYSIWISTCSFRKIGKVFFAGDLKLINPSHISIGDKTSFAKHCILTAWNHKPGAIKNCSIEIGNNCVFGEYNHITCSNKIVMGNNVLTGRWVTITDNSHGTTRKEDLLLPPMDRLIFSKGPVIIGNNVWIGDKVTILPNITIGDGVIIGANSVVTKDIPSYCVVAGNPAKIIKQINV